jgi:hypothetical protein
MMTVETALYIAGIYVYNISLETNQTAQIHPDQEFPEQWSQRADFFGFTNFYLSLDIAA